LGTEADPQHREIRAHPPADLGDFRGEEWQAVCFVGTDVAAEHEKEIDGRAGEIGGLAREIDGRPRKTVERLIPPSWAFRTPRSPGASLASCTVYALCTIHAPDFEAPPALPQRKLQQPGWVML
jgi:hypothetical protein